MIPEPPATPEHLFRLAFDLLPTGIVVVDASGTLQLLNHETEAMFGYTREEMLGRPVEMLVPERLRRTHAGFRGSYHGDPQARPMGIGRDLTGLRKDGTEFPIEIGLNPVQTEEGLVVLATIVDISERRRMEERMRQGQKLEAIGTLAGGIAHDFNNLLLAISGYAELARNAAQDMPQVRDDLQRVLGAADRGRQLVQRILTFSRQREAQRVRLRLDTLVTETLQLLRASLPGKVELVETVSPDTPEVMADETQMHQVLMNLATNAAQAVPSSGGRLEVRLEPFAVDEEFAFHHPDLKPGPHARLVVSDTGRGMAPEVIARALEPFFTTKPPGTGTGLGLSMVHGIVRGHGGAMELRSRADEGTQVEILLPACEPVAVGEAGAGPPDRGRRILFVEDEEFLADLGRRRLEEEGYVVTLHTSSPEALETFRAQPEGFDLVISDNTMPRLTGLELSRAILAVRPDMRILMVSGLGDAMDSEELRARGIRRLLSKPHTSQQLIDAVRAVLDE